MGCYGTSSKVMSYDLLPWVRSRVMVTIFFTFPGGGGGWENFEQLKGVVFWTIIFFIYFIEMFFETSFSFTEAPYV